MATESAELNVSTELLFGAMRYAHGQTGPYGHIPVDVAVLTVISRQAALLQNPEIRSKIVALCKSAIEGS